MEFYIQNKVLQKLFLILLASELLQFTNCQYYASTTLCGALFSEDNLGGQNISLFDRDQSISLHDDQRSASGSWPETKSIGIQSSCSMEICNETYFDGECRTLLHGQYSPLNLNMTDIASARCTCEKECKCEDIFMKKNSCARAYLEGGCRNCHSLYVDMNQTTPMPERNLPKFFPDGYRDQVTALRLRKGCTLTLYSGSDKDGFPDEERIIDSEIVENFEGEIESFECNCDDSQFKPKTKPPRPESYPPFIDVPSTLDDVIKMLMNDKYSKHPGLRAAHQSLKAGRSSRNAYILLLGSTGSGKSLAINLLFDHANLTKTGSTESTTTDIHEFRIPIQIDELGVANSELRVIDTPGLGDTRGPAQDAMFLATLDNFLASHEELKDRIPNVVLIFHKFSDNRFKGKGAGFVQMLRGLDQFRTMITDENFSNVIFVLSHFCGETPRTTRRPENRLAEFRRTIEDFSTFPRPTIINVAENKPEEYDLPMVNGYSKLPNNEYYPRNLFEKLEFVTIKGMDPIGQGVFRSGFRDSDDFNITSATFKLLPNQNDKVLFYLGVLSNSLMGVNNTEISQLLKHVWEEKVDPNLKRKFPESLAYLQKALNMKNINTNKDIPRTSKSILEMLTSIRQDEATSVLLDKALGIKAPAFPSNTIAGHGYNVFKDAYLTTSPFVMGDVKQSDIGYMIPSSISVKLEPGDAEHFHLFDDKQQYIQYRIQSLGIEGTIGEQNFTGIYKPGHNIKSISFKNDSCTLSATREVKLFTFELNDRPTLTEEFKKSVRSLPPFNQSDHENVHVWNTFFNEYGTHVVKSIYGGGAIEIELKSSKPYDTQLSQAMFDLINFAEEMSFLIISDGSGNKSSRGVISSGMHHLLKFIGGDPAYHTTDLTKMSVENAARLLLNWKKSLKYHPSVLTTEMRLMPMGQIVKKLGQNYSSAIEEATSLLFNSQLRYIPPKPNQEPKESRDQMGPVIALLQEQMAASSKSMSEMMENMRKMEENRQKWEQEMAKERLRFEKEERERQRKFEQDKLEAQKLSDAERKAWETKIENERVAAEQNRKIQQEKHDAEMRKMQEDSERRYKQLMEQMARRPTPPPYRPSSGGRCLKAGTKILMADGTEKTVEKLKIDDLIMDMDLNPTRVLGVNYQYLLDLSFYGFDNQSFFFTGEHMFVGPKVHFEGLTIDNSQFYVTSLPRLLGYNPLMKYWDVKEMGSIEDLKMYHYDSKIKSVQSKSVGVFEDPTSHPMETPVYFLYVDSPSGTYFANGYLCKVDVPPVERWPNTMSLLFTLMRSPPFEKLMEREYSLDTIHFMDSLTTNLNQSLAVYFNTVDWDVNDDFKGKSYTLMTMENARIDEGLHRIFTEPTSALLSIMVYGKLGNALSSMLDSNNLVNDLDGVATRQHSLYKLISAELEKNVKV